MMPKATVTIDGEEWTVLDHREYRNGPMRRTVARIADNGILVIDSQTRDRFAQEWDTGKNLRTSLNPTETAAIREMLAPGAADDRKKLATIAGAVNGYSNGGERTGKRAQAAMDAIGDVLGKPF